METSFLWVVSESDEGQRLDRFLLATGRFVSRHQIQKLIEKGAVRVDGVKARASHRLKCAQEIRVEVPDPVPSVAAPEPIPVEVLYEDRELLVVNKPAGMVVHPAAGHSGKTLVNALLSRCHDLSGIGGELRPGIVHRLDKQTSGLLVVAKGDAAHLALSEQFKSHSIRREYVGLVFGVVPEEKGRVEAPIGRHVALVTIFIYCSLFEFTFRIGRIKYGFNFGWTIRTGNVIIFVFTRVSGYKLRNEILLSVHFAVKKLEPFDR